MVITEQILTKRPFCRPLPRYEEVKNITAKPETANIPRDRTLWEIVSQGQYIREYYPTGHLINSPAYYPDRTKYDEEKKQFYTEKVVRCSFPF